jgi:rubrerythrin
MNGISSSGKEAIIAAIEKMFDALAYKFLGNIPKVRNKSPYYQSAPKLSLPNIFVQALRNKELTQSERDVLKGLLNSSHGYIESLKSKVSSEVAEAIDALVKEHRNKNTFLDTAILGGAISAIMLKAKNNMKVIAEAETTKTRNFGHLLEIGEKARQQNIEDPLVFFIVSKDNLLCPECKRLHLLPDGITPRVYKRSELSYGWHKRGDDTPSACGEHPSCRCSLTDLPPGWGFKGGYVSYIGPNHDEYKKQRDI